MDDTARFRAHLHEDANLAARLAACETIETFASRAAVEASALGLSLSAETIAAAAPPNPAGIAYKMPAPATITHWPGEGWVPAHVSTFGPPMVDWAWLEPATGTLDQGRLLRAAERPINRFARARMTLSDFVTGARAAPTPKGFVFHMSRCGSTLLSRALGALPRSLSLSELYPVNDALLIAHVAPGLSDIQRQDLVRAVLAAYRGTFVRFDAWHALALPLIRRTFPEVPWIFLFRDPVEVLVSHAREPGAQLVTAAMAHIWNIPGLETMDATELAARALGRICENARAALETGRGIAVDYREMPSAIASRILPHFGVAPGGDLKSVLGANAKRPHDAFASDVAEKQHAATPELRAQTAAHVAPVIAALREAAARRP